MTMTWQDRLISATRDTQLGAIARCALAYGGVDDVAPCYVGKASITSDGFVMCSFTDTHGRHHMGAFVGDVRDLEHNVQGVADHLSLTPEERAAWFRAVRYWIAQDYRQVHGLLLA